MNEQNFGVDGIGCIQMKGLNLGVDRIWEIQTSELTPKLFYYVDSRFVRSQIKWDLLLRSKVFNKYKDRTK